MTRAELERQNREMRDLLLMLDGYFMGRPRDENEGYWTFMSDAVTLAIHPIEAAPTGTTEG